MTPDNWIFYKFYQQLREEVGLPLDFQQYLLFVELYLRGTISLDAPNSKEELYDLLVALWLSRPRFADDFRRLFEAAYEELSDISQLQAPVNRKIEPLDGPIPGLEHSEAGTPAPLDPPPPEPPVEKPKATSTKYEHIFLQFSENSGTSYAGEQAPHRDTVMDHPFIFSDDKFLPLPHRRAERIWQRFRVYPIRRTLEKIDVEATVQYRARHKVLDQPVYRSIWENRRELVAFIDLDQGMEPFGPWVEFLIASFQAANPDCRIHTYYYKMLPQKLEWENGGSSFIFYEDHRQTEPALLHKMIKPWHKKRTAILILSHANLNGRDISDDRLQDALIWLRSLRAQFKHVLWANPYPPSRWNAQLAAYASLIIPMVEMNEEGLREAVQIL